MREAAASFLAGDSKSADKKASALRRDLQNLKSGLNDQYLKHSEAHSDASVMHLRGGRSVTKSYSSASSQHQDDSMKNVQTFMYLVAGLCGIFLVGAFMKDVWADSNSSKMSTNPMVNKALPAFDCPCDFTKYGAKRENFMTGRELLNWMVDGSNDESAQVAAQQSLLEIFHAEYGHHYDVSEMIKATGIEPFYGWDKVTFEVKTPAELADNNKGKDGQKANPAQEDM